MMRITETSRTESVVRLRLEGRLTHATAAELNTAVDPHLRTRHTVLLDLAGVSFADTSGVASLLELRRRGTVLIACSGFLAAMLHADARATARDRQPDGGGAGALLERLRAGEQAALAEVVTAHAGGLLRTARRLLVSEEEARRAVQDVVRTAAQRAATADAGAELSAWLRRLVIEAALVRRRGRRQPPERPIDALLPRFDASGEWAETPRAWGGGGELFEPHETGAMVRRCVDRLPDPYRTVLLLRDVEELDLDETAQLLGIAPGTVRTRLHRARQALRALIAEAATAQRDAG